MVDIALVFVGFAILILFLLLGASVYFIPRVLDEEEHETEPDDRPENHAG